ncbi:tellurite resistance TerB family protein [Capilliphycus salinus ALCB114379]|uniref:tellurite resistance TerB family protein n=1 Tax=Capilliphycus salinus TaxID=2768948 RepID=UPI0039A6EAC4
MSTSMTNAIELTPAEAFAAIALTAVAADGVITDSESQIIKSTLKRMNLFNDYTAETKTEMMQRLLEQIQEKGYEVVMQSAIAKLPANLKDTAFAVATDIILSDGDLADEEEELLNALYNALGISEEMATKIIDVMLIKNKG